MWSLFKLLNDLARAISANTLALVNNTQAVNLNTVTEQQLHRDLAQLHEDLGQLHADLTQLLDRLRNLPDPDPITITITAENGAMLTFKINLPPEPTEASDIESGELTVTVGGGTPAVIPTVKGQTEVAGLTGNQGDTVEVTFAYVDDAGNRSVHPSSLSVELTDTIPPANPGELSLEVTAET